MINILKSYKFKIGIHTNGSNPDIIKLMLQDVDFIGMDIKTSKNKYNAITNSIANFDNITKSIELIVNSSKLYEFRTTLYPKLVALEDCLEIAKVLKQYNAKEYLLQQFDDSHLTNCAIKPYTMSQIKLISDKCNEIIKTTIK